PNAELGTGYLAPFVTSASIRQAGRGPAPLALGEVSGALKGCRTPALAHGQPVGRAVGRPLEPGGSVLGAAAADGGQRVGGAGDGRDVPKGQVGYRGISARRIWSRRSTVLLPRTTFGGLDLGRRA